MKALIADIDDTICPSTKPIDPELAREIDRIIDAGLLFAFISGGTLKQLMGQLVPGLSRPFHVLAATGTHYASVSFENGKALEKEVYKDEFPEEQKKEIRGAFEALIKKENLRTLTTPEDQLQDRGTQITLSALGRHAPDEKKRALDPDGAKRKEWIVFLRALLGDKYSIRIGGTSSIDVTPLGMDKGKGIQRFLEIQKILPSEVLYFGDKLGPDGNDYPARRVVDCIQVRDEKQTLAILRNFLPTL